jgi:hypothetical protein
VWRTTCPGTDLILYGLSDSEHVVLLFNKFDTFPRLSSVVPLSVLNKVFLRYEALLVYTVVPLMLALLYALVLHEHIPEVFDGFLMIGLCGSHKAVAADIRQRKHLLEIVRVVIAERLWVLALLYSAFLNFESMFIGSCCEPDLVPSEPVLPGHGVAVEGGVEVPDVRSRIHIEDWRGDHHSFSTA